MNDDTFRSWADDRRLELVMDKALNDASNQWNTLIGKEHLQLR